MPKRGYRIWWVFIGWFILGFPICLYGGEALGWRPELQIVVYVAVLAAITAFIYWRDQKTKSRREEP